MSRVPAQPRTAPAQTRPFTVHGEVASPLTLSVADLRERWDEHRADVTFDCATSGPQHHTFHGPLLREVVGLAAPRFDPGKRKLRSRFLLAVSGGDGHRTVLAWAEIDADFGGCPALLATRMDDEGLDTAGAQLVVPTDRCGARYISAVTGIWVGECRVPGGL